MPKMKTHKASKKRFRVTAHGQAEAHPGRQEAPATATRPASASASCAPLVDGGKIAAKYVLVMGGHA